MVRRSGSLQFGTDIVRAGTIAGQAPDFLPLSLPIDVMKNYSSESSDSNSATSGRRLPVYGKLAWLGHGMVHGVRTGSKRLKMELVLSNHRLITKHTEWNK